jgi:hypothetical protein
MLRYMYIACLVFLCDPQRIHAWKKNSEQWIPSAGAGRVGLQFLEEGSWIILHDNVPTHSDIIQHTA